MKRLRSNRLIPAASAFVANVWRSVYGVPWPMPFASIAGSASATSRGDTELRGPVPSRDRSDRKSHRRQLWSAEARDSATRAPTDDHRPCERAPDAHFDRALGRGPVRLLARRRVGMGPEWSDSCVRAVRRNARRSNPWEGLGARSGGPRRTSRTSNRRRHRHARRDDVSTGVRYIRPSAVRSHALRFATQASAARRAILRSLLGREGRSRVDR